MLLEFGSGHQLEVDNIIGGPRLVMGVLRDTLRIEINPKVIDFKDLKPLFEKNDGRFYTFQEVSEDNEDVEKVLIGEGYSILVSVSDEKRQVNTPPGKLLPDQYEEIYAVTVGQLTYQEHLLKQMTESNS